MIDADDEYDLDVECELKLNAMMRLASVPGRVYLCTPVICTEPGFIFESCMPHNRWDSDHYATREAVTSAVHRYITRRQEIR